MAKLAELVVLDAEPGRFALYGWKNITVAIWLARVETDAVERLARASAAYCVSYPQGLSNIHLVQQDIGLPDGRTRKRLIELSRGATPHLATVSAVVGGQGFWASRMRSLITGVHIEADEIRELLARCSSRLRATSQLPAGPVSGIQGLAGPASQSLTPPAARSGSTG